VQKLKAKAKTFGYLPEKKFIYTILRGMVLVFSQSDDDAIENYCPYP
jgi:hypothetical protein